MSARDATKIRRPDAAADDWFTTGRFAMILAGLIFVCFPLVVLGTETFFFRDFGSFGYPLAFYHRETFWRGEIPFWNPYNSCGVPFMAQWNTLTFYPLSLFYLLFPLSWSLGMFCLLHLFLGGMGMYSLAHRWTQNRLAAAVAGAVFAFNGLTWHALMWPNNSAAMAWAPWVLLATERAWREGGRRVVWAGLAAGVQLLAGAPEVIILTWVTTGALWLADWNHPTPPARMLGRFFCVLALGAGLAAVQLLPFLDLLTHSQRGAAFGDASWAMPLTGALNYLVPLFHEFLQKGVYSQYAQFWTCSYYLGVGTIALAVIALWRVRDRRTWVLVGLSVFSLLVATGEQGGLYKWMKETAPILGFMRFPIKFVILPTFVFPLLAACGLAWFQALTDEQWAQERKKMLRLGAVLVAVIGLIALWNWLQPMVLDDRRAIALNAAIRIAFLLLILSCLTVLRRVTEFKLQRLLRLCLVLFFWFDIFTHTPNLSPTVDRSVFEPDSVREFFKWDQQELRPGVSRAMESKAAMNRIQFSGVDDHAADVNGRRLALFMDYNLLDHAAKFDGLYSLDMHEMDRLVNFIYYISNDVPHLKDFLGIARISNPTNEVDWVARATFLPLITGGQQPVFADDDTAAQGLTRPDFDPTQMVFLEPAARAGITANRAPLKITPRPFTAQRLGADVEATAPAMLVIAQAYYHDWHAYVDGAPVKLWRANYAFQALEVPAGRHEVKLVYEDAAFEIGLLISLASALGAVAAWVWFRRKANS